MLGANREEGFLENRLDRELNRVTLSTPDRALVMELTYGVMRWRRTIDWLISRKSHEPKLPPPLQALLQVGLYQMFWLDRIPDHAAVNETVEMAKTMGLMGKTGFLNALLRGYARERDATRQLLADLKIRTPALGWSHPDWLVERWGTRWEGAELSRLLAWNNSPPATFARVNTLRTTAEALTQMWNQEGVQYKPWSADWTSDFPIFQLESHPALDQLPSFQQGGFYIQDPSTLLAVRELAPLPGQSILDACAAPGGKTALIAQRLQNQGEIIAQDTQADRLQLVTENCRRLGITCVQTLVSKTIPERAFDRILVDAPCSNTGVLRRRIELRWRLRQEEFERLQRSQLELLRQTARRLKPGGTLVYSTCSLEWDENQKIVRAFLAESRSCRLEAERALKPQTDGVDGAYVARLVNTATA